MTETIRRDLAADPALAPSVQATVEQAALGYGLDASGAARLGQAVEEVFVDAATRAHGSSSRSRSATAGTRWKSGWAAACRRPSCTGLRDD